MADPLLDAPVLTDIVIAPALAGLAKPRQRTPSQPVPAEFGAARILAVWRGKLLLQGLTLAALSLARTLFALAAPFYVLALYGRGLRIHSAVGLVSLTLLVALAMLAASAIDAVRARVLGAIGARLEDHFGTLMLRHLAAPASARTRHGAQGGRAGGGYGQDGHAQSGWPHGGPTQPGRIGRDLDLIRQLTEGSAALALLDLPWAPTFLVAIAWLHWSLGLLALTIAGGLLALCLAAARAAAPPSTAASTGASAGGASAVAHDIAATLDRFGDAVTRHAECAGTMNLAPGLTRQWHGLRRAVLDADLPQTRRAMLLANAARFLRLFAQPAMLGGGALLALRQDIGGGAMFAASMLLGGVIAPLEAALGAWGTISGARAAMARARPLQQADDESYAPRPRVRGELNLESVSWTAAGSDRAALRGITLKIEAGATLAVIGPSGAGKSTLARVLCGAVRPGQGIVRLDGADFATWDPERLGAAIGYLPQEVALFPGTVAENIARFGDATDHQVIQAARLAGAHDMIMHLSYGYATQADGEAALLSAGQRQRIGLARALFNDPPILVLDEPNASLDAEGEAALIGCMVEARRRRRTVIMITHNTALVRVADFVATMVGGHILKVEQTAALLGRPARLAETV